jgi:hypothetical protein
MHRPLASALLALVSVSMPGLAAAQDCQKNFQSSGNLLTGKTYKTWAVVPGVKPADAFPRAMAFTVENGFTVISSDAQAGVISAAQSVSYGQGKSVPLNLTLRAEGDGTRIGLQYATSGGVMSPEDAIRKHFCLTIDAAAAGGAQPTTTAAAPAAAAPAPAAVTPAAPAMPPGYAMPTDSQRTQLTDALKKSVPNSPIRTIVDEASPVIGAFVQRMACLASPSGALALNEYAAPGVQLNAHYNYGNPMSKTRYHHKGSCMSVTRVHGWIAPAANAIKFEAVFKADDSGETVATSHEVVKQPGGDWLFTR